MPSRLGWVTQLVGRDLHSGGSVMPQTLGRTRPSIYLVAASGHPNYGDELIAATWLKRLARLLPGSDVWVDCSNPGSSAVLLGDLHPRVRFTDTFWRLCWEAPSQEPWEVATFVQRAIKDPGVAPRWLAGIELAAQMDIVHVVGGGFINVLWPRHVGLLAASVAAAGRSGGRAVMTGQSLWPVATTAASIPTCTRATRTASGSVVSMDTRVPPFVVNRRLRPVASHRPVTTRGRRSS